MVDDPSTISARLDVGGTVAWLGGRDDPLEVSGLVTEELDVAALTPGAGLLEVVATMDRLRSPGGCPWDAEQTHESLGPYLLEEAYEAFQAIEDGDPAALREELGDVLLQVAFHSRIAAEAPVGQRWGIDDVAAGLVAKLVRRHPHVFGSGQARDAREVAANWDLIKAAEKGRTSVTDGVPLALPALTLAGTLQRKALQLGVPAELVAPRLVASPEPAAAVGAAAGLVGDGDVDAAGELLFTIVAFCRDREVDPEAALRGAARRFRDRLAEAEGAARAAGVEPATLEPADWQARWW
ncbi:MAG TPA: MazG family protein [Mycobacteriales bacterium]|nr:MazG family protein [Mycobacteriales bacterium]